MLANHPNVLGGGGVATNIIGGTGLFADGTAAAPSISFASTINTGFYKYNSNAIGFSAAGSHSLLFSANGYIYGAYGTDQFIQLYNSGNIVLTAAGTNQNITLTPSGSGNVSTNRNYITSDGNAYGWGTFTARIDGDSVSNYIRFLTNSTEKARFTSGGNFLLGTTVDSGALLQVGTNTSTSAGGMVFGTDTSLYRDGAGGLSLSAASGSATLALREGPTRVGYILTSTGTSSLRVAADSGYSMTLFSSGALALTLDTSQNATFAGFVRPVNVATASAPAYAKGVIYFDTTLNKLRVGGATAFETITSV